jgi:hypothetical protein
VKTHRAVNAFEGSIGFPFLDFDVDPFPLGAATVWGIWSDGGGIIKLELKQNSVKGK